MNSLGLGSILRQNIYFRYYSNAKNPFRVCIIGSGPSGFYTALRLLKKIDDIHIDMLEAKREPFGLIRYGVAPDHPEVKNCTSKFEELVLENSSRFSWLGGVVLGKDVTLEELVSSYDSVVLAIGAQLEKRLNNVPGENLTVSSTTFTHWMNGTNHGPTLMFNSPKGADLTYPKCALVIGNGNVALDTARSLVGNPKRFSGTSIGTSAMKELMSSTLRHISIVGRRGPLNSSFAAKELREIFKLCHFENIQLFSNVDTNTLEKPPSTRSHSLLIEELSKSNFLKNPHLDWPPSTERSLSMLFYLSPTKFIESNNALVATELQKNHVSSDGSIDYIDKDPITLPSALVVTCLGYGVAPIPGAESLPRKYPQGPLLNERGYVNATGLFVSGWTKTGPAGALSSTMLDSYETADCIIEKMPSLLLKRKFKSITPSWLVSTLCQRKTPWLSFSDWKNRNKAVSKVE